jgi:type I restriction enzyme M protein
LKQRPLTRTDLDDFVASFHAKDRTKRVETERFRRFAYADLIARDKVNLDITWLKDGSEIAAGDLPDPDVLITEILEDLAAASLELAAALSERGELGVGVS